MNDKTPMPKPKVKVGDVVLVEWRDAHRTTTWTREMPPHDKEIPNCRSVGWVARIDSRWLTIRPHKFDDGTGEQHFGDMEIPYSSVESIERML